MQIRNDLKINFLSLRTLPQEYLKANLNKYLTKINKILFTQFCHFNSKV